MANSDSKVNVLMVGTGEYTTGYVGGKAADSDKGAGVVALTMFDLRRRQKVDRVGMCGVNVRKQRPFGGCICCICIAHAAREHARANAACFCLMPPPFLSIP